MTKHLNFIDVSGFPILPSPLYGIKFLSYQIKNGRDYSMERFFNTAGPVISEDNYHIDPLQRLDWEEIQLLIENKRYFVLHAPRQTGKTSSLLAMMKVLNEQGRYACAYANIEEAQAARGDEVKGIPSACYSVAGSINLYLEDKGPIEWYLSASGKTPAQNQLKALLHHWAQHSEKPTVLFLDEVDTLVGNTLISLLRQIRSGYAQRPLSFPQSIVLCGVRDVRDYRIHGTEEVITGGSAFNIKSESLRMGNFSEEETRSLWLQHTDATGQSFDPDIFPELWEDTRGQPWLVNALAHELTWKYRPARDRAKHLTLQDYFAARESLVQSRATHLDQLADTLQDLRINRVISALLSGQDDDFSLIQPDDQRYVEDLGLINTVPQLEISNRIYREIIPRELTVIAQSRIPNQNTAWYVTGDNRLDMHNLLKAFQQFFREHADSWIECFDYKEAGPQLLMQAFLQRIINGGGRISREYGLGRKRTDLFIEWPTDPEKGFHGPIQRVVIELKLQRGELESVITPGLEQTSDYAGRVGADESHLVIFNRDSETSWDERIWHEERSYKDMCIEVWGA